MHALTVATRTARIHLIGHSLGGLIIRYAVRVLEALARPHRDHRGDAPPGLSSRLVRARTRRCAAPARSDVSRRMHGADRSGRTRWIAYYSNLDLLVPSSGATIGDLDAENVLLRNESHTSMLFSPHLARDLTARLAAPPREPAALAMPAGAMS